MPVSVRFRHWLLLMLACLWAQPASAQSANEASLRLMTDGAEQLELSLDGEQMTPEPSAEVSVHHLEAGTHRAEIHILPPEGAASWIRKDIFLEGGQAYTFVLTRNRRGDYIVRLDDVAPQAESVGPSLTPGGRYDPPPSRGNGDSLNNPCDSPIPPATLRGEIRYLTSLRLQTTRMVQARKSIAAHCYRSADIREIVALMNLERDRLALAKFAVDYAHDPAHYHVVMEAFRFESTARELQAYLASYGLALPAGEAPGQPPPAAPQPLPGYHGPIGCEPPSLSPQDFERAKQSLASKSFASTRMTVAKQAIRNNCLLSRQVKEVLQLFSFESDRVELAKFAHPYTYDQGNYYLLNDAFDFESSVQELNEYLEGGAE